MLGHETCQRRVASIVHIAEEGNKYKSFHVLLELLSNGGGNAYVSATIQRRCFVNSLNQQKNTTVCLLRCYQARKLTLRMLCYFVIAFLAPCRGESTRRQIVYFEYICITLPLKTKTKKNFLAPPVLSRQADEPKSDDLMTTVLFQTKISAFSVLITWVVRHFGALHVGDRRQRQITSKSRNISEHVTDRYGKTIRELIY